MSEQTTTQLTGEEWLASIEARANAATSGPWCTDSWEIYQGAEYVPGISQWIGETCRGATTPEQDRADAAFVAAARTDVPALVAEVRELLLHTRTLETLVAEQATEIDRLRQDNRAAHASEQILQQQIDAQAKEIDRLRDELAGLRQGSERWAARCDHIAKQGLRWKAEADGRKAHGQKLEAELEKAKARAAELEKDSARLAALEAAGVDNWEGYNEALEGVES